jgi:4-amino-4-deoxy-L-arabinose transferase-like glycosyltransferase
MLIGIFLVASLANLDRFPPIHDDEPSILGPGYKLFQHGVYGLDTYTGFYGQERIYLEVMPLMPMLQGASAQVFGIGVRQMRLAPVALGALTLTLVLMLGRALAGAATGLLAMLLLLCWQWSPGGLWMLGSGIPLIDIARLARYDILVAPLGLAALWAWVQARHTTQLRYDLLSGLLAGMAGLAHLYGLFWGFVLLLALLLDQVYQIRLDRPYDPRTADGRRREKSLHPGRPWSFILRRRALWSAALLVSGVAIPWLPWVAILRANWSEFVGQSMKHAGRFDLSRPAFYLDNLLNEGERYALFTHEPATFLRAGFWLLVLGVPLALLWLGWHALRLRDRRALWLLAPSLVFPLLFALLISKKSFYYLMTVAPLFALALAWGLAWLLRSPQRVRRMVAWAIIALVVIQGVAGIARMQQAARRIRPPEQFFAELRQVIPPAARVIGPQQYWLALPDREYRSFGLAFLLADPTVSVRPLAFDAALEQVAPRFVLLNSNIAEALTVTDRLIPLARPRGEQLWEFMRRHRARAIYELRDSDGLAVQLYQLDW